MKKLLVLFFALLLPVLIYLFLKTFGRNEFDVPVLFADSVSVPADCKAYQYPVPYTIPDSVLTRFSWNAGDTLTIFVFEDGVKQNKHERDIHIARIFTEFKNEPLQVVRIYADQTIPDIKRDRLTEVSLSQEVYKKYRECIFLLSPDRDAVAIDRKHRIRGHYNLLKRDDADRLIMQEMNILFKRY